MSQRLSTIEGRVMPSEQPCTPNHSSEMAKRLDRLEESLGYSDRTMEQLSAEIADMNKRMQSMGKRLAALEARLSKLQQPEEEEGEG